MTDSDRTPTNARAAQADEESAAQDGGETERLVGTAIDHIIDVLHAGPFQCRSED